MKTARNIIRTVRRLISKAVRSNSGSDNSPDAVVERRQPTENPLVTVVVPCYNASQFVGETIQSVRQQTLTEFECVIVNDGSTDDSAKVIDDAIAGDQRFKVVDTANSGLSAARNEGLRRANAATVTFLDSDDLLLPSSLLDRYQAYQQHSSNPYLAGVFSGVIYRNEDVTLAGLPNAMRWMDEAEERKQVDFITARGECPFPAHAPLLATEVVTRLGGFSEAMRTGCEDWDLWLRVMRNGYIFVPAEHRTVVYRQRKHSMVRSNAMAHASCALRLIENAYSDIDPAELVWPTDAPFDRSLGYYHRSLAKARRLIRFAALEYAANNHVNAAALIERLPPLPLAVLQRHIDIYEQFVRGMKREAGLSGRDTAPIQDRLARDWEPFEHLVVTQLSSSH